MKVSTAKTDQRDLPGVSCGDKRLTVCKRGLQAPGLARPSVSASHSSPPLCGNTALQVDRRYLRSSQFLRRAEQLRDAGEQSAGAAAIEHAMIEAQR
jgi:hypothetical protein